MLILRAANRDAARKQFDSDTMVKDKRFNMEIPSFVTFYDGFVARPQRSSSAPGAGKTRASGRLLVRPQRKDRIPRTLDAPAGNVMMGMGRTMSEGKVIGHEGNALGSRCAGCGDLYCQTGGTKRRAVQASSPPREIVCVRKSGRGISTRVIYLLKADGTLEARIEGKQSGRDARWNSRCAGHPANRAAAWRGTGWKHTFAADRGSWKLLGNFRQSPIAGMELVVEKAGDEKNHDVGLIRRVTIGHMTVREVIEAVEPQHLIRYRCFPVRRCATMWGRYDCTPMATGRALNGRRP